MTVALNAMEPEPNQWKIETPLPSTWLRLSWWLGVYFAGVFIIPVCATLGMVGANPAMLLWTLGFSLVYPCGLYGVIAGLLACVWALFPHTHTQSSGPDTLNIPLVIVIVIASYGSFITHLVYTLKAKTHRAIRRLLLGLIPLLILDLVGWYILLVTSKIQD